MKLSILIATVIDRRPLFEPLYEEFKKQAVGKPVEIIYGEDNKEISIGAKRQRLLELSSSEYIVFFDSDDFPEPNYIDDILEALEYEPDCVGFKIRMTTNGRKPQTCVHSLQYPNWDNNIDGYDYVRNVTHFNPVKKELALQVGFQDKRYGEDKIYSDQVTKLCTTEVFLDKFLFHYRYTTTEPFYQKYGIK